MPPPTIRERELEAAIAASPDDPAPYLVYADWLQEQGDPHGELIAVQAAAKSSRDPALATRERELFARLRAPLTGPLDLVLGEHVELEWRFGFITRARLGAAEFCDVDGVRAFTALRGLRAARFLRELELNLLDPNDADYAGLLTAIRDLGAPSTLRRFTVDVKEAQISWTALGDLSRVYPAFANLEHLYLRVGAIELGAIDLPKLRSLEIVTGSLSQANVASVSEARWPELKKLVLYFGDPSYGGDCTVDDLDAILSGEAIPHVNHLALANAIFADDIARALGHAKVVSQLRWLDLSKGAMSDEGGEALLANQAALQRPARIDVRQNFLSEEMCEELRRTFGAKIMTEDQGEPGERYVQVSE